MAAKHYDFLIIGGGIVGCAIAWQLRRLAPQKSVALIEKNSIGSGSTSRSAAAFRHQFSSRGNILLSQIAYETYSELGALFGIEDGGFREHGYLLVYTNPDAFATAEQRARRQARAGVPVEVLSPKAVDELPRVKGFFDTDALCGATWCARDGFLDPLLAAQTFFQGARALGAELITATACS